MIDRDALRRVRVVLVRNRTPGNAGATSRAMKNFGLADLFLVDRATFKNPATFETEARRMAWNAGDVLDARREVGTLAEALEGTVLALAASHRGVRGGRSRGPREAARELLAEAARGHEVALVFGSESDGLLKDELGLCAGVLTIPSAPEYTQLNLAQSVVVCAHALYEEAGLFEPEPEEPGEELADHAEVLALCEGAEDLLRRADWLKPGGEGLKDEVRRLLLRARPSKRELNLLRGMLRKVGRARF